MKYLRGFITVSILSFFLVGCGNQTFTDYTECNFDSKEYGEWQLINSQSASINHQQMLSLDGYEITNEFSTTVSVDLITAVNLEFGYSLSVSSLKCSGTSAYINKGETIDFYCRPVYDIYNITEVEYSDKEKTKEINRKTIKFGQLRAAEYGWVIFDENNDIIEDTRDNPILASEEGTDVSEGSISADEESELENNDKENSNSNDKGAKTEVESYLVKDIKAFDHSRNSFYCEYNNDRVFSMAGKEYPLGYTYKIMEGGYSVDFDLGGKYSYITYTTGHVDDGGNTNVITEISLDGKLFNYYLVDSEEMPKEICFSVKDVNSLKFCYKMIGEYKGYPVIGIANPLLSDNITGDVDIQESLQYNTDKKYLGSDIRAFDKSSYSREVGPLTDLFTMKSKPYIRGITNKVMESGTALYYNLEKQYNILELDIGFVDDQGKTSTDFGVLLDGQLYESYKINFDDELLHIEIPVKNIEQLKFTFKLNGEYRGYPYIGIANVAVY